VFACGQVTRHPLPVRQEVWICAKVENGVPRAGR
jgi:hypothetical protein